MAPGDIFAGSYMCGNVAWLLLHMHEPAEAGVLTATFHFLYPSSTQHGAYTLKGKVVDAPGRRRRLIQFEPGEWISSARGVRSLRLCSRCSACWRRYADFRAA